MGLGEYHRHVRKRIHKHHEPYPHPDKLKRAVDNFSYIVGVIGPLLTIPQIYRIWFYQEAAGVSLVTWSGFVVVAVFWLMYGLLHKEKPLIMTYILWIVLQGIVVAGVVVYG